MDETTQIGTVENDNQQTSDVPALLSEVMEVDPVDNVNQPHTPELSGTITKTDESKQTESNEYIVSIPTEQVEDPKVSPMDQDANATTESDFDKTNASLDESLHFTEKSINFSQINADENDDSNDAFNALKETEVDVFSTKEELVEKPGAEEDQDQPEEKGELAPAPDKVFESINPEEKSENVEKEIIDGKELEDREKNPDEDYSADLEDPESTDKNDPTVDDKIRDCNTYMSGEQEEKTVEDHGDDEIGTTTEMEGVDENLCLLGDAEREITEADKEKAMQAAEVTAEDESMTAEPTAEEGEEETLEAIDKEVDDQAEAEEHTETISTMPTSPLKSNEIREICEDLTEQTCLNCENSARCQFQLLEDDGDIKYLCTFNCVVEHREDNPDKYIVIQKKVYIYQVPDVENDCEKCLETKMCKYRFKTTITEPPPDSMKLTREELTTPDVDISEPAVIVGLSYKYFCDDKCLEEFINTNTEKYVVKRKVYVIDEILDADVEFDCIECNDKKPCKYKFARHDESSESYVCNEDCLNLLLKEQPNNFRVKRRSVRVRDLRAVAPSTCIEELEMTKIVARTDAEQDAARQDRDASFVRRCAQCCTGLTFTAKSCQWETMDFCDEKCLGLYQNLIGGNCTTCHSSVTMPSLGKYCVRFGFDVKQFCSSVCLDVYKKVLKQCALCQRDLSTDEDLILAKVGDKGQFKDFCNQICLKRYEDIINPKKKPPAHLCSVCNNEKPAKIVVNLEGGLHRFCSNPCFSAFKFVNNVFPDQCDMCLKYFERQSTDAFTIYRGDITKMFCTKVCMNTFIVTSREIWQCNWCKVSKYNYDMIVRNFGKTRMCSLNCLTLFEVSVNALSRKRIKCDHCKTLKQPQYHLTMSDASIRNFCTYQCVLGFQSQFTKKSHTIDGQEAAAVDGVVPAGTAKRIKPPARVPVNIARPPMTNVPIISRIQSLGRRGRPRVRSPIPVPELTVQLEPLGELPARVKLSGGSGPNSFTAIPTSPTRSTGSPEIRIESKTQVVTIPPLPIQMENKSTMCKSIMLNKGISCRVSTKTAECQTEDFLEQKYIIPVPIPIFIPQPMYMYNMPVPVPVPFALPIPIPIFIPTTRNSSQGIMKEIKKIQEKMPTDPFEAELLMMAEMVAGDKKREETDSDSDAANDIEYGDNIENNSSFNEDLVQMAFKMASGNDFDDPPVDLENEMTANTISQNTHPYGTEDMDPQSLHHHQLLLLQQQREAAAAAAAIQAGRGRKRINTPKQQANNNNNNNRNTANKRIKRELDVLPSQDISREPAEKPDANMCLKYTFGVNAWKQWVATKNADLEKSSMRRKPFKSEILQLTADELNYSLCLFVKEVRKPNGSEYAPDTIYYLVLGIQQYLYENGRIDNIFTDRYYDPFTDCLDEVAKKFSVLYNDSQYIVTRVEEEHLWECKQLGAHSPHVLLSTLMFFNTKHFNLVTVDEHMELSFSHIMKHWKRNPNQPGAAKMPGSRNVLLRFYPPQSSLEANSRKKKVYEQQENEENPLRCPVKLYEFYLSKCPESVKTRNDVFYLQPERSCVPDSPVWYSTQPLSRDALSKMLHRVKMVKEINIALLTS